jgi:hypothetical protein
MPYIKDDSDRRSKLVRGAIPPTTDGDVNYLITQLCHMHIMNMGGLNYDNINAVIGILECAKLELYRIIAAPYEDEKKATNGHISYLDSGLPNEYTKDI